MEVKYLVIGLLIGISSVLAVLCLMNFKSIQWIPTLGDSIKINEKYDDRDFILDYEKTYGIIHEPKSGKLEILERPEKGKAWLIQFRSGYVSHVQIDLPDIKDEIKQDKFTGGILFGLWGAMTIDPDNYSLKYYLLSPETHQVSEKEFRKAQSERER
ncbi:MAG: hypothetical protein PHC43_01035 [Candidatus Marinimicrobia bacterium]|jgi:hypothetical protein|nr:hypothetical protein [Candidatus Neomarinimicrobiota bacterium]MDD5229893.1 hypothetical protein [Candidatus Neomarinimicrobiota bacterium]MDD5539876.1 hypothetical protein [Candidatus Neomarinimicrobiota bacterium]